MVQIPANESIRNYCEQNKQRYLTELRKVNRPGMDRLISWVERTDFFYAPISATFPGNHPGALCEHSLNMLDMARALHPVLSKLTNKQWYENVDTVTDENLIFTCLLSGLYRIDFYKNEVKKFKNEDGSWMQYPGYVTDDAIPLGTGEKSLLWVQRFVQDFSVDEMLAIRWHKQMDTFSLAPSEYDKISFLRSISKSYLTYLTANAYVSAHFLMLRRMEPKELATKSY